MMKRESESQEGSTGSRAVPEATTGLPADDHLFEDKYRLLFEANPHPMWVYDLATLQFLAVNDAAIRKYGYSRDEFLSMTIADIRPKADVPALLETVAHSSGGLDESGVWRHQKNDGTIIFVEITSHALRFEGRPAKLVLANDITQRRQAEEALKETEKRFRFTFEHAAVGIAQIGTAGRWIEVNQRLCEMLGYTHDELMAKTFQDISVPEELTRAFPTSHETPTSELESYTVDRRCVRKDGSQLWTNVSTALMRDASGAPKYLIAVITDISACKQAEEVFQKVNSELERRVAERTAELELTNKHLRSEITERKRVEHEARESQALIHALIEGTSDAIFLNDLEGRYVMVNSAAAKTLGKTVDEVRGKTVTELFPPETARIIMEKHALTLSSGIPSTYEVTIPTPKGPRTHQTTKFVYLNAVGKPAGVFGISRDIMELKRTEEETRRLAAIVESSCDAIVSADPKGNVISWNKAAEQLFGFTEEEMLGQSIFVLSPPDKRTETQQLYVRMCEGLSLSTRFDTVRMTKEGRLIEVSITLSAVRERSGAFTGMSAIIRDISERKRLEKQILEISDFEKQRIGQDLHDDLCQYLVGISLLSNVLTDNLKKKSVEEAEDARQINSLVRQSISKARGIAKGLAALHLTGPNFMINLEELAISTENLFGVNCRFECDSTVEFTDNTIAVQLFRIIQEAVNNAAKHSQAKNIAIKVSRCDGVIAVSVTDNGIGYPESGPRHTGMGINIMDYRARMIDACLEIHRIPSGGTAVTCILSEPPT